VLESSISSGHHSLASPGIDQWRKKMGGMTAMVMVRVFFLFTGKFAIFNIKAI
jgi:hypothetical protein